MAEIEMQRRKRNNTWMWVLAAVVVIALGIGAWYLFANEGGTVDAEPAAETRGVDPATEQSFEYTEPPPGETEPMPPPEPRRSGTGTP